MTMKMMKKILFISLSILFVACNPLAKLPGLQSSADTAFDQGNFQTAYDLYKQYVDLSNSNAAEVSDDIYTNLALASANLDLFDEADALFGKLLKNPENASLALDYAQILQSKDKAQEELALWDQYSFEDAKLNVRKIERQVALNSQTEQFDASIAAYEAKGDLLLSKETTMSYIKALEATGKGQEALKLSSTLIKTEPEYTEVKIWKAKYLYERADKRYKYEMAKYNKNKNATTYAYLRRDLKKISSDFRASRDLFEQLHKQNPEEKMYIKYLKNCYLRLEQKADAAKMDKLLK